MQEERFLVTGALGCIGAWTVCTLVREDAPVVVYDLEAQPHRLRLLLSEEELARVRFVAGDIADLEAFEGALDAHEVTRVIHLAGLQIPHCRSNPPLGARVNVVGTVNVFEAVKRRKARMGPVVYASSAAVFGTAAEYPAGAPLGDDVPLLPHTHYGVFKQANEGTAHVYGYEDGVASIGLRPYVVYGVGRDQGLTSAPTSAMLAAAVGRPFHVPYGGKHMFQYAADVARAFVQAARSEYAGAGAFNLGGASPWMGEVVSAIERAAPGSAGKITFDERPLPYPPEVDGSGLEAVIGGVSYRPLAEGIEETVGMFRALVEDGRVDAEAYLRARS